jgi:hypothetical protein
VLSRAFPPGCESRRAGIHKQFRPSLAVVDSQDSTIHRRPPNLTLPDASDLTGCTCLSIGSIESIAATIDSAALGSFRRIYFAQSWEQPTRRSASDLLPTHYDL